MAKLGCSFRLNLNGWPNAHSEVTYGRQANAHGEATFMARLNTYGKASATNVGSSRMV